MLLAPPPPRPAPQDVYVIRLKRTYFGLHHEQADGTSRTGLVAFVDSRRAAANCDRLWRHRLANGDWPKRVLMAGEAVELDDRGLILSSKNELRVDRVGLTWLKDAMGRSGGSVDLVEGVDDERGRPGRHHRYTMGGERHSWKDGDRTTLMFRRQYLEELMRKRHGGDD